MDSNKKPSRRELIDQIVGDFILAVQLNIRSYIKYKATVRNQSLKEYMDYIETIDELTCKELQDLGFILRYTKTINGVKQLTNITLSDKLFQEILTISEKMIGSAKKQQPSSPQLTENLLPFVDSLYVLKNLNPEHIVQTLQFRYRASELMSQPECKSVLDVIYYLKQAADLHKNSLYDHLYNNIKLSNQQINNFLKTIDKTCQDKLKELGFDIEYDTDSFEHDLKIIDITFPTKRVG